MDRITAAARSANMRAIRSTGMRPEITVRKLIHGMGYRYRLHRRNLPGRPDLVFPSQKKVIFVHGCFWHQHAGRNCKIVRKPKSNTDYWLPKLRQNVKRDAEHFIALKKQGWKVLVIWECEVCDDATIERRVRNFLKEE